MRVRVRRALSPSSSVAGRSACLLWVFALECLCAADVRSLASFDGLCLGAAGRSERAVVSLRLEGLREGICFVCFCRADAQVLREVPLQAASHFDALGLVCNQACFGERHGAVVVTEGQRGGPVLGIA